MTNDSSEVAFFNGSIIYHIIDAFEEWRAEKQAEIEATQRESLVYPGRLLYLKDHTFRAKNPAIVGMKRVIGGRIHIGQKLMKLDGTPVGQVKSLENS